MSKFDDRVEKLVDGKITEALSYLQDGPEDFPDLEASLLPVMEKLKRMHNLLADVKQEIRRVEKAQPKEEKKEEPLQLPEGTDITNLTLEDLRQYVGPGTDVVPYNPLDNVWDALSRNLRRWLRKLRIPGVSPDYMDEVIKGFKEAAPSVLTPKEMWYIITHPDVIDPLSWGKVFQYLFFPSTMGPELSQKVTDLKKTIREGQASEKANSDTIREDIHSSTETINTNIEQAVDTADDLAQTILSELMSCCSTLNQKLDIIRREIEKGGAEKTKQDTLLIRKKMAELDSILDDLRRELRRIGEVRSDTQRWFEEAKRDTQAF